MLSEDPNKVVIVQEVSQGLNPCFSGICSLSSEEMSSINDIEVLILVLVEYAL